MSRPKPRETFWCERHRMPAPWPTSCGAYTLQTVDPCKVVVLGEWVRMADLDEFEPRAALVAAVSDNCHAGLDGDCSWEDCPQLRDGEPLTSGRDCPLWQIPEEW